MLTTSVPTPRGTLDSKIRRPPGYCPAVNRWRVAPTQGRPSLAHCAALGDRLTVVQCSGGFLLSASKLQNRIGSIIYSHFSHLTVHENYRPEWLQTDSGGRLELDFYIEELNIAIEVQGQQHYQFVKLFHGDHEGYEDALRRDRLKRSICKLMGVRLLEVASEGEMIAVLPTIDSNVEIPPHRNAIRQAKTFRPKNYRRKLPKPPKTRQTKLDWALSMLFVFKRMALNGEPMGKDTPRKVASAISIIERARENGMIISHRKADQIDDLISLGKKALELQSA